MDQAREAICRPERELERRGVSKLPYVKSASPSVRQASPVPAPLAWRTRKLISNRAERSSPSSNGWICTKRWFSPPADLQSVSNSLARLPSVDSPPSLRGACAPVTVAAFHPLLPVTCSVVPRVISRHLGLPGALLLADDALRRSESPDNGVPARLRSRRFAHPATGPSRTAHRRARLDPGVSPL